MQLPYKKEIVLNIVAFVWLLFVLTNANTNLGGAYLHFLEAATILLLIDNFISNRITVTFQKSPNKNLEAIIAGAFGYLILLVVSFIILKFASPITQTFGSIISSLGASNPIFSNSVIVNFITIGIAAAYIETQFMSRLLEFIGDRFNISVNRENTTKAKYIILVLFLSALFVIFHLTAKGVQSTTSLIIVFVMMFISLILVGLKNGETRQAVWLHIIANSSALLAAILAGGKII